MRGIVGRLVSFAELDLFGDLLRKAFVPGGASDIECLIQRQESFAESVGFGVARCQADKRGDVVWVEAYCTSS